jgi:hypothetical protein
LKFQWLSEHQSINLQTSSSVWIQLTLNSFCRIFLSNGSGSSSRSAWLCVHYLIQQNQLHFAENHLQMHCIIKKNYEMLCFQFIRVSDIEMLSFSTSAFVFDFLDHLRSPSHSSGQFYHIFSLCPSLLLKVVVLFFGFLNIFS